jgi:rare lipoprotein A (peptidoglycan hydrolase)
MSILRTTLSLIFLIGLGGLLNTDIQVSTVVATQTKTTNDFDAITDWQATSHQNVIKNPKVTSWLQDQIKLATPPPKPVWKKVGASHKGIATWYRNGAELTVASREYPNGTTLRIVNTKTRQSVDVIVNDYGPQAETGAMLDLNVPAFKRIGWLWQGKISVEYFMIKLDDKSN